MSTYRGHRFTAYDGEAINDRYVLLANDQGDELYDPDGLRTEAILTFLARPTGRNSSESRVMFGLSFDVNHWMSDLTAEERATFFAGQQIVVGGRFALTYLSRRQFILDDLADPKRPAIRYYDVQGFFGSTFLAAVGEWLPEINPTDLALLQRGKRERGRWRHWSLDRIRRYNRLECALLVTLMHRVKAALGRLDPPIKLRHWHGPGAIATHLLGSEPGLYQDFRYMAPPHIGSELLDPFKRAYFGGRIELMRAGTVRNVWRYDLNSAYPYALSDLHRFTYDWRVTERFTETHQSELSVWRVSWRLPASAIVGPFPFREQDGLISYPREGEGWYWWPEVVAARRTWGARHIHVHEGWYHLGIDGTGFFPLVTSRYAERQRLRAAGDPAELLLKLGLNAMYGKLIQRSGAGHWYCLPWAGYVTSHVRALLMGAIRGYEQHVIAFATDGIVTDAPLPNLEPIGTGLGAWDVAQYRDGTFVLPGLYRLRPRRGQAVRATRSYDPSRLVWSRMLRELEASGHADIPVRTFVGHQLADQQPDAYADRRLQFVDDTLTVDPCALNRKRVGADILAAPGFPWSSQSIDLGILDVPEHPPTDGLSAPIGTPESWDQRAELVAEGEHDAAL